MSGQAGIWNFDGQPTDHSFLEKLASALEPHGPDGGNAYIDGSIAMVYSACHTTLESHLERQPYVTSCGTVITWDGRLDNREEFIPQLWEELVADQTDVAIIAAAFERWGTDCFRRIVGDWAVSIWRPMKRELLFACDYMAIKHVFYYLRRDRIWWSTDLAPLVLLSGDKFQIDDDYIAGYFANHPDAHLTPYRRVSQVPGGHFVRIRNGSVSAQRYWQFSAKSRIRYKTDAGYEEHFRHVFRQSVRRRLRCSSPILAELSGGLDSSSIVCMADDILANEGAQTPRLDTLSYYDKTEPNGDDWIYFQKVEAKRGRAGFHIDAGKYGASTSLVYTEFVPRPGYRRSRELEAERADFVREGNYRAVLSGIGGDEFLGGIPDPRDLLADLILQFRFVKLARQVLAWSLVKRRPWIQLLWQSSMLLFPRCIRQYLTAEARLEPWIGKEFASGTKLKLRQLGPTGNFDFWLPSRRAYSSGVLAMAQKMATEPSATVAFEEFRYPYLDQSLIEFILSIPASQLLRPGERRSLMRRSLANFLPPEVLSRRTKGIGYRAHVLALEKDWENLQAAFNSPFVSSRAYIDRANFLDALNATRHGKEQHIVRLLRGISLEFWLRDLTSRCLIDAETATLQPLSEVSLHANA